MDNIFTSKTPYEMVVYRYAPTEWLEETKDGMLEDKGFFSTTTIQGSTSEAYIGRPKTCFKIHVPKDMPYLDLTDQGENEMLFPRGLKFKVLDNETIEMCKPQD